MNFLAHLVLAGDDEGLRLGAMLGDFVRGRAALADYPEPVRRGILLHRHIDSYTDSLPAVAELRARLRPPFRRYGGIIVDLAFDHELAKRWARHCDGSLESFDAGVRDMLARQRPLVPDRLVRFMQYADRRGLFASYRDEAEILRALIGIGKRLSRPNPLHRVSEIWPQFEPEAAACFEPAFGQVQSEVARWLKSKSNTTGS